MSPSYSKAERIEIVINNLRGTATGTLEAECDQGELDADDVQVTAAVDAQIFNCTECGWWCEIEEEMSEAVGHDEWICAGCARDNHGMEDCPMIQHRPQFDRKKVIDVYEKKDGVPIKYICTSAVSHESVAGDIFYRATPHPEFGNRYFMLRHDPMTGMLMISSADKIESADFHMILGTKGWEYSQHQHDFYRVEGANLCIDGGRSYVRLVGDGIHESKARLFHIKDGEFTWDRNNTSNSSSWAS
jgi:hypothetical protein